MNDNVYSVSRAELKAAMRNDCISFFAFYIGESLDLAIPEFHEDIWEELLSFIEVLNQPEFVIGRIQKLFAVPRDHAKSTIAKLAVILFMRYSPLSFTLYVSKTGGVAKAALLDVISWLKSPREVALYGEPNIVITNMSEGLWILEIYKADGNLKRIILKSVGQQHQVRGTLYENRRPEFVVMDDIEDLDTVDGGTRHDGTGGPKTQQEKLDNWVLGSLMKATAKRCFVLFIGNMIKSTSLLARLSKDPAWNPTVFGALVRDKVTGELRALWPERWSVESLLADYRVYCKLGKRHTWESEMMNLSGDKILNENLDEAIIIDDVHPEQVKAGFICLDPAFGQESWHDESAITVHVQIDELAIPIICHSETGRWRESELLDKMIEASYYWNINTWCIETQAAQKLLIPLFHLLLKERMLPPEMFVILPVSQNAASKATRITAFVKSIADKAYALTQSQMDLKEKLEAYSPATKDHDDLCDSAAYGPIVWESYGKEIIARGVHNIAGSLLASPETYTDTGEVNACLF